MSDKAPLKGIQAQGSVFSPNNTKRILFCLIVILLVSLIYSNTLNSPFIFDDEQNIQDNPHIRLTQLDYESIRDAAFDSVLAKRPIANISFALNYYFHGYDLPGYHLVNILIHIMTGMFLFFFIKTTLETVRKKSCSIFIVDTVNVEYIAFAAALIWAVHPLQTQSVTYIVQRMNSMAAMFYILSMLMYVKARLARESRARWALYGGCVASGIFALGSKEIAATLPVFMFLYEWYFFQDLDRAWLKRNLLIFSGILAVFGGIAFVYLGGHPFDRILAGYGNRDFTLVQRVLTEFRIVILYMSLLVFPHPARLNLDYDFPLSYSLINPVSTLISLMVIIGLFGSAVYLAKRERLISFCILWFLGNLAIESSVIALELVYEHRTYLPSMFVILLFVMAVFRYVKPRWTGIGLLCVLVGVLSFWTYERNKVWTDAELFWRDCIKKAPKDARPISNLGMILAKRGDIDGAIEKFSLAVKLDPSKVMIHNNLANALLDKGMIDEAIYNLSDVLKMQPENYMLHYNLARALKKQGKKSEAILHFKEAVKLEPDFDEAHNLLGKEMAMQGMIPEATFHFSEAIRLNPNNELAYNNLANVFMLQGKVLDAIDHYNYALQINPDYMDVHRSLGGLYYQRGELDKAIEQFREIIRIDQDNAETQENLTASLQRRDTINNAIAKVEDALNHDPQNPILFYQLGDLYRMKGNFSEALDNYEKALSILPIFPQALHQIAAVYSLTGEHDKAVMYLKKVVELNPDDPDAYYNLACMYSLMNDTEKAVLWLKQAVEKGFDNWDLMGKDPDLNNIRKTEDFKKVLQGRDDQ